MAGQVGDIADHRIFADAALKMGRAALVLLDLPKQVQLADGVIDLPAIAGLGFARTLGDHADEARLPGPNDEQPAHGGTVSVGAIRRACHAKPDARLRAADREDFPERLSQSRRAAIVDRAADVGGLVVAQYGLLAHTVWPSDCRL